MGREKETVYESSENEVSKSFTGQRISLLPPLEEHFGRPGMTKSFDSSLFDSMMDRSISPGSPSASPDCDPNSAAVTKALPSLTCLETRSMFRDVATTG